METNNIPVSFVLPAFNRWTVEQKISFLTRWCRDHENRKPQKRANAAVEAMLASWLNNMAQVQNRYKLLRPEFDVMKQFDWWESWLESMENRRRLQVIPGFDEWTTEERVSFLTQWCRDHENRKPQKRANDAVEAMLASWLNNMAQVQNRYKLLRPEFDVMKQFDWWESWLESMENRRRLQKIPGFVEWTTEDRVSFLTRWCRGHENRKPQRRTDDVVEAKLASWLNNMENKYRLRPEFDVMKQFDWWESWSESMKKKRMVKKLHDWDLWTLEERLSFLTLKNRKPLKRADDATEAKLASWLNNMENRYKLRHLYSRL